jgi:hypothetical protein
MQPAQRHGTPVVPPLSKPPDVVSMDGAATAYDTGKLMQPCEIGWSVLRRHIMWRIPYYGGLY